MTFVSRSAFSALLSSFLALWPLAAAAQAPSDPIRGALSVMPQAVMPSDGAGPVQIEFGNPRALEPVVALQSVRGALTLPPVAAALSRSLPGGMRNATLLTDPGGFEATTGLRLTDLGQMLSIGRPPARVDLVSVAPDAAGACGLGADRDGPRGRAAAGQHLHPGPGRRGRHRPPPVANRPTRSAARSASRAASS